MMNTMLYWLRRELLLEKKNHTQLCPVQCTVIPSIHGTLFVNIGRSEINLNMHDTNSINIIHIQVSDIQYS